MIIASNQPYLFPYVSYLQLINIGEIDYKDMKDFLKLFKLYVWNVPKKLDKN